MHQYHQGRRHLLSVLTLAAFGGRASPATAQSGTGLQPLWQPPEPTKAAFLARARALRDEAVREGDQAYGAVVVRNGVIVGEGRNYVVLQTDRPLRIIGRARRGAPTWHARPFGMRCLFHRDALRHVPGRSLLGTCSSGVHREHVGAGFCTEAWMLSASG